MNKRVLILSASMGMGHIRAAQALERAFNELDLPVRVRHEDSLEYTNANFRNLYADTYLDLVNNAPNLLGWLYDYSNQAWKNENRRVAFERFNTGPLSRLLNSYRPDVVLSTHFLPADIISSLICQRKIHTYHGIVITDLDLHAMWLCHHYSRYYVALDETKEHLRRLGIEPDRIKVSGIPIDPEFSLLKPKQQMRSKHGLLDKTTILLSAGGYGVGPMEQILAELKLLKHPAQIVAMCGWNQHLANGLNSFIDKFELTGRHNLRVIVATPNVDELMAASDLIIGKPGGLTTAEAMTKGLVFVIVNPIPGQEEKNSDHLLEEGAAIRCNNLPALAFKIDRLLGNPEKLAVMREKSFKLARPDAAKDIANDVYKLLTGDTVGNAVTPRDHHCATDKRLTSHFPLSKKLKEFP